MEGLPETRFARSGDLSIAYQVVGDGPIDIVFVPGFMSHVELNWEYEFYGYVLERLAGYSRLIVFDKRGTGLSDRPLGLGTFEERMDDVRAVMDAAGVQREHLIGVSEGGAMCALMAATHPERVASLVLMAAACPGRFDDDPVGRAAILDFVEHNWSTGRVLDLFVQNPPDQDVALGHLARFDGPSRPVACAHALRHRADGLGLRTRAGAHTGEIELRGDDVGGIAVHIASRVAGLADAGEVLVSRTVKDLSVGSGLVFEDRGEHALKGVPGAWQLFAAAV